VSIPLDVLENIIDTSGVAPAIEKILPAGVRHRQLTASTLLAGMMLTLEDDRPAHLTRVHAALTALPGPDQARLGVTEECSWSAGARACGGTGSAVVVEVPGGRRAETIARFGAPGHPGAVLGEQLAAGAGQPRGATVEHVDRAGIVVAADVVEYDADGQVGETVVVEVGLQPTCGPGPGPSGRGLGGETAGTRGHADREDNDNGDC
jgi:hypothetical protein